MTIAKLVTAFGRPTVIMCDGRCDKAWGINTRPSVHLDPDDEDDFVYLADGELGAAPDDPGTYEGGHAKPTSPGERLNKWCYRECERSKESSDAAVIELRDWSRRVYNQPDKHRAVSGEQPKEE